MDVKRRIILEVEKNPMLFDKADLNYKRTDLKEDIWRSIGEKIGMSSTDVQAKWRNIRDCMVKCVRKNKTASDLEGTGKKPYKYEQILAFLIPTIPTSQEKATSSHDTATNSNLKVEWEQDDYTEHWQADGDSIQNTYASDEEMEEEESNEETQMTFATPNASTSTPRLLLKKVHGSLATNAMDALIMDYIRRKSDERPIDPVPQVEDDDIMLFLKSLAPTIRTFPPRAQAEVRFSISKIIHDAEMEYLYKDNT